MSFERVYFFTPTSTSNFCNWYSILYVDLQSKLQEDYETVQNMLEEKYKEIESLTKELTEKSPEHAEEHALVVIICCF